MKEISINTKRPLRLRRKDKEDWENLNYQCIVILDEDVEAIRNDVSKVTETLIPFMSKVYAVVWYFEDLGEEYCLNLLKELQLVFNQNGCSIYEIGEHSDISKLLEIWGEWQYGSLDLIF